jgi:hypothetical protein
MADELFNLNNPPFLGIMWRFIVNIVFLFILIRIIYFKYEKKEKFLFTYFLMGIMTFFIVSMLRSVYLELTMGFALFAVFGILRLRTKNFSVKDMAYTFTVIGISVINSLKMVKFPVLGIVIINCIIVLSAYLLEEYTFKNRYQTHMIIYDNLEFLKPDKEEKLLKDISARMGKDIYKVEVRRINYRKGIARLNIHFKG